MVRVTELTGVTQSTAADIASGKINFVDVNAGDLPTAKASFTSFTYQNAAHIDVTAKGPELTDILGVEANLVVVATPGNNNNGSATWTYNVPDSAFDFLAAGETLTLTYTAEVDSNYLPNDLATLSTFTITINGTNDVPVITTGAESVAFISVGTSTPGPNLPPAAPTSNTLAFTDPDLTDTHIVSTGLTDAKLSAKDGTILQNMTALDLAFPRPMGVFESALSASVTTDSTGTGKGTITWTLADISAYYADIVPARDTLTLTYTVTVTDSQGATSSQNVIVTITGSDPPAVVWVETTATAVTDAAPGDWNGTNNWETGAVPKAADDVIIITNQLQGSTPFYPVTIKVGAAALAHSVTMNDFGSTPAELDIGSVLTPQDITNGVKNGTLTIGGELGLSADSILKNFGTLSVGTIAEILNTGILQNSGLITLGQGGDFKDSSSITNSGTIEVSGGTLNVQVGIANSGAITIDPHATLTLNGGAISGGTLDNSGTLDSTGTSSLSNVGITNSGLIESTGGTLTIDPTVVVTLVNSGTLEANGGELDISEAVTNNATLQAIDSSTLKLISTTVTNGTAGTVTVGLGSTLDLVSANIGGGTLDNSGTLDSTGTSSLSNVGITNSGLIESTGGTLTIEPTGAVTLTNSGTLEANGGELDISEAVTNNATLQAIDSSTLKLTSTTVTNNTGGTVTVGLGSTLDLVGAGISGGTLDNSGTLDSAGTSTLSNVGITNSGLIESTGGTLTIEPTGAVTLTNSGTLEANGGELDISEAVTNNATLQAIDSSTLKLTSTTVTNNTGGTVTVGLGSTLDLVGAGISGGTLDNSGTLDSTGTSSLSNVGITNSGLLDSTGGTLTIEPTGRGHATSIPARFEANGGELDISEAVTNDTQRCEAIDSSTLEADVDDGNQQRRRHG